MQHVPGLSRGRYRSEEHYCDSLLFLDYYFDCALIDCDSLLFLDYYFDCALIDC